MLTFYQTLFDHLPAFFIILALTASTLYFLLKKYYYSIFDPLFFMLVINETFCITDVIFLYCFEMIDFYYFMNYLLTEGVLIWGILQFKPRFPQESASSSYFSPSLAALFKISLPVYSCINLFVYIQRGIPLFLESRTVVYAIGGGFGFFRRVSDVLLVIIMYYILEVLRFRRWKPLEWIALCIIVLVQILSGAKAAVLILVFTASLYCYFTGTLTTKNGIRIKHLTTKLTFASIGALFLIAQLQSSGSEMIGERRVNLLGQVAARLVMSGDALIYSYTDNKIESLSDQNPMGAMFREYLTFFRIAPPESLPKHLGVQITNQFLVQDSNFQTNEKHNLVGYLYFGSWGSLLFSYIIGTIIGFVRYVLPNKCPQNWMIGIPFIILASNSVFAISEPDGLHQALLNLVVIFVPLTLGIKYLLEREHIKH